MKNKIIFVACDTSKIKEIKNIIIQTKNSKLTIIPNLDYNFFIQKMEEDFWKNLKEIFG